MAGDTLWNFQSTIGGITDIKAYLFQKEVEHIVKLANQKKMQKR